MACALRGAYRRLWGRRRNRCPSRRLTLTDLPCVNQPPNAITTRQHACHPAPSVQTTLRLRKALVARHGSQAAASLASARPPLLLSPFVLAELDHLIASRVGFAARASLLEEVKRGAYVLHISISCGTHRTQPRLEPRPHVLHLRPTDSRFGELGGYPRRVSSGRLVPSTRERCSSREAQVRSRSSRWLEQVWTSPRCSNDIP